jgi:uncharacterized SAM-binding protein YcdF (DUF218 family)
MLVKIGQKAVCKKRDDRRRSRRCHAKRRSCLWLSLFLFVLLLSGFAYKQYRNAFDRPKALLVLGGDTEREEFAANFARSHPDLDIWVSSGSNPEYAQWVFDRAGIEPHRLHLDYQAVDTVTNFTTLVGEFQAQGIDSVYLITSDDHMLRAKVIGEIVLGSRGITYKAIAVPSGREAEPVEKSIRDGLRAILWVTTGRTGASLGQLKSGVGNRK